MNTIHFVIYSCAVVLLAFCYCFLGECLINEVIIVRIFPLACRDIHESLSLSEQRNATRLLLHQLVRFARTIHAIFNVLHCSIAETALPNRWQVLRLLLGNFRRCELLLDCKILEPRS